MQLFRIVTICLLVLLGLPKAPAEAQEARRRWERMNQIRTEKFDQILPEAMRENGIDMWITMIREANYGTLYLDFGQGYTGNTGYYIFTDRGGDRIERAALGISGYRIRESGAYDLFQPAEDLADFVRERDPQRIGINTSRTIGPVDNLTYTGHQQLVETLGEPYASRLVSGEKLVSDFRSRRTTTEIAAFAEAGEISREIAERAFSNEVITPDVTMLEDVAWWMMDQLLARGLDTSFGMPSVYITGPDGIESTSNDRIIRRGDLLMIDWGIGFLNMYTDMKRLAYVLRQGEAEVPPSFQRAFDKGREARTIITNTIRSGIAAAQAEQEVYDALTSYPEDGGLGALLVAIAPLMDMGMLSAPEQCNPDYWEAWSLMCMPVDTESFGTFYVPKELRQLMSAEFEDGQPTGFAMGAITSAFHTGPL